VWDAKAVAMNRSSEGSRLKGKTLSSTQSVWGNQQLVELVRGEACGFGQSRALLESVLQTVRVKRAHGFVVFGRTGFWLGGL
jgi:hypothetical protein